MSFRYSINKVAFNLILENKKLVEGRLFKNSFKKIKVNDTICFFNNQLKKEIIIKVTYLNNYLSFKKMLESESINRVTPLAKNLDDALDIYKKFYTKKDEERFGVLAIGLNLI